MAKNGATWTIDTKVLDAIIKNLNGNTEAAVETVAFAIEGDAKVNVQQMEAIDTGALLNSIGVSMKGGGDAEKAAAEARARRPEAIITPLPKPSGKHTAHVGPQVEYAAEIHFGNGHMPGRPYLLKAVRDNEKKFRDALGKAVRNKK